MRSFLVGLYSGFLLSALRAPLGLELLQLPACDPNMALAYRGAALLAVAIGVLIGLRKAPEGFSPIVLLIGVMAGFETQWLTADFPSQLNAGLVFSLLLVLMIVASQRGGAEARPDKRRIVVAAIAALAGWLLLEVGGPEGHRAGVLTGALGCAAIALVGWITAPQTEENAQPARHTNGRAAALVIGGAGLAMMCEGIARPMRQLGGGLPADDSVFAVVFLALAAFGAIAFGRMFKEQKSKQLALAGLFVLAWPAALGSMRVLRNITTERGLSGLVRSFGLDTSLHGMLSYDAAIAGPTFVVAAFLIGSVIAYCKRPVDLASLCVGAAAGMILVQGQLGYELTSTEVGLLEVSQVGGHSMSLILFGAGSSILGGVLLLFSQTSLERNLRWPGVGVGLLLAIACLKTSGSTTPLEFSRPWERTPPLPTLHINGPEGVVTIENSPGGKPTAMLNGLELAPAEDLAGADLYRLQASWALLPEDASEAKVLLVGQLTPARSSELARLGAARVDRSAAWHRAMPILEQRLFGSVEPAVAGEILDPRVARAKLHAGEYDLVIVTPRAGELPSTRNLASPAETTVVVWFDGTTQVETAALGEQLLVLAPQLTELYVAVARGPGVAASRTDAEVGAPGWYAAGDSVPPIPTLELLRIRERDREQLIRARLAARLAAAEVAPGMATGLAKHFAVQSKSSPFDTWEAATELDDEAMEIFARAAAGAAPDALAIQVIESLALLLRGKRRIDPIYPLLEPAAKRHALWPQLELALGQADLELLDPESAVARLVPVAGSAGVSVEALAMLAEAQQQVGDDAGAALSLDRAVALAPGFHALERRQAIAWMRADRPEGPAALEEALLEHPEDEELLQYRLPGPWKPVRPGYHALGRAAHDH